MVNKDWTGKEAWAANQSALEENPSRSWTDPTLPYSQWFALQELDTCQQNYENDPYFLMTAIRICANHQLPLPDWAAKSYIKAYDNVNQARAKSWNSVFGNPYPKGRHLSAIRKKLMYQVAIWNEITLIRQMEPDTPVDENLFETVGKKFGLGKTLASEYYYSEKKRFEK
ncbi:hypothetical protein SAMN05216315_1325 [Nitrosospira sp. Nsp18]|uniref:hypothetical protein n=1 Tax=Nitrosospira sp. Nsp18 TaxID=1855334 RepID=UPI0008825BE2|nr:hypothetical protein [Nitrosospira sp. Nsp18]SDA27050.1 hypothetical protein SAMN05216315_1325 [Nitrosospira sp. Nsp18]